MPSDWSVAVPLADLMALRALPDRMDELQKQNAQLRREMDALQKRFYELMVAFGDLKRGGAR